jgi:eukaryotic-like serine/threonine-protein kinase
MNAWTLAKERPLADILLERGFLQQDEHQLIAALVAKQLAKHGGDVDKSLASLSPTPRFAAQLARIADADVLQSLAAMSPAQSEDADRTRAFEEGKAGDNVRYRILRPHARGGLGEVFVARDEELGREVALKEIQPQHADNLDSRGRFVREAEVTGGLEHPGVVAVYGLCSYADGRPFYAMRFIQGDSLKEAIERFHKAGRPDFSGSEFRQLLGRFIDVCQAIAYAHSRGVLHRDLKPGNIMLGKFGETLVVDWGLAKVVGTKEVGSGERTLNISSGSGSTPTVHGQAIGTPAFMSPEQASGRLDELGPATDVYSLGATLYTLLANRPPIDGAGIAEVLQKAERGEWTPTQRVNLAIPAPLAAICAKAMALPPADRYSSAQSLASDVERYLADESVTAIRDSLIVRVGRWSRRHRTSVATAAATLLVGAIAMGFGLAIVGDRNTKLATANTKLDEALKDAGDKRSKAEAATKLADERFEVALDSIKTLIFEIQDKLATRSGMKPLREALLKEARAKLEKLTKATEVGAAGRALWGIHATLGDIALDIDGQPAHSKTEHERARAIAESLVQAEPNDTQAQKSLATSLGRLGDVALRLGDAAAARRFHDLGLAIRRTLAQQDPNDLEAQRNIAEHLRKLGETARKAKNSTETRSFLEQELEIRRKLAKTNPTDVRTQRDLSDLLEKFGFFERNNGSVTNASRLYGQGLEIKLRLAEKNPSDPKLQRDLSRSLVQFGYLAEQQGDKATARIRLEKSLEICRQRAEADPYDVEAQLDLSESLDSLGYHAIRQGNLKAAREFHEQSLEVNRRVALADPGDAKAQRTLLFSLLRAGETALLQNEPDAARVHRSKAVEIGRRLNQADPLDVQAQMSLHSANRALGWVEETAGNFEAAVERYREAIKALEKHPNPQSVNRLLTGTHTTLARAEQMPKVMADPKHAITFEPQECWVMLGNRTQVLARRGDVAGLKTTASAYDEFLKKVPRELNVLYDAARAWALTWRAATADRKQPEPERNKLLAECKTNALERLRTAVKLGFSPQAHKAADPDLAELRQWPEYAEILAGIKATAAKNAVPKALESKGKK